MLDEAYIFRLNGCLFFVGAASCREGLPVAAGCRSYKDETLNYRENPPQSPFDKGGGMAFPPPFPKGAGGIFIGGGEHHRFHDRSSSEIVPRLFHRLL